MRFYGASVLILLLGCFCAVQGVHKFIDKDPETKVHFVSVQTSGSHGHNSHEHDSHGYDDDDHAYHSYLWHKCPKNEVYYSKRKAPRCPFTCETVREKSCSKHLEQDTSRGRCDCAEYYARLTLNGPCKHISKCPRYGDDCNPVTEERKCSHKCKDNCNPEHACPLPRHLPACSNGCYCKAGFSRINGVCVPSWRCQDPQVPCQNATVCLNPNEEHTFGSTCNEKCSPVCTTDDFYIRKGCFCKAGYKRINGVCHLPSLCPTTPTCGANEQTMCALKCDDQCPGCAPDGLPCVQRCACMPGYKRINGQCQNALLCPVIPPVCPGPNEVQGSCAAKCDETCTVQQTCVIPPGCTSACVCAAGFKRINGVCVPENQCKCGTNESYFPTGRSICNEICPVRGTTCSRGTAAGCYCNTGMIRIQGQCRTFDCSANIEV